MRGITRSPHPRSAAVLLAIPFLVSAVLGIGVQIQPDAIVEGSQISLTLSNVTDDYTLNTTLVSTFPPASSPSWFNVTNWRYDFSLQKGQITVVGGNVNRIRLLAQAGSTLRMAEDTGAGNIVVELPMDILTGVYYDYRILYEVHNSTAPITITLIQQGSKVGTDDSVSTPAIYGADGGNLSLEVLANGTLEGSQVVRVGNPGTIPATTPPITQGPQPPTSSPVPGTVPGTTLPATPSPPVQTPPLTPSPVTTPGPEDLAPWITGYGAVIIIVTLLADYFIMKD
jgi:hypothetical protein